MGLMVLGDEGGQSNIDFLFGVGVLLLTFIYVAAFIPGLFVPYQPGAIDLSSVAYRTSAILAEDPGWFSSSTINGTSWEEQPNVYEVVSRIGLADDKDHPNVISQAKINGLNGILANHSNYIVVRDHLGLSGTIQYNISVSVKRLDNGMELVDMSAWPTPSTYHVESMERNVLIDTGKEMFVDCDKDRSHPGDMFTVNITDRPSVITKNLTIRIFNTTGGTISDVRPSQDGLNFPSLWSYGADYVYYVNGVYSTTNIITINSNDVVEIVILPGALNTYPVTYMLIQGSGSMFGNTSIGSSYNYYHDPKYPQKSVCYPGILRLEVWSDAIA